MSNPLEKAWEEYNRKVDAYAVEMFNTKIKPWLEDNQYSFLSGNGTYWIGYDDSSLSNTGYVSIDPDDLPKRILDILSIEIPGMPGNDLGSIMPDYHDITNSC